MAKAYRDTLLVNVSRRIGKAYPAVYETVTCLAELEVDVERLIRILAHKAIRNTKGVSKLAVGIKVKVTPQAR